MNNLKTLSTQTVNFSNIIIPLEQLFILRKNVYGLINNKPITPGHVLVVPRKVVPRLKDLSEIETLDLWLTTQEVAAVLQKIYTTECQIGIQDGSKAGQSVEHVHIHIIPKPQQGHIVSIDRKDNEIRSEEDMKKEAILYRDQFPNNSL